MVVSPCLGYMEETLVPILGSSVRRSLPLSCALDRCFPHWLGSGNERPLSSRSMEESSSFLAHQLPRDDGGLRWVTSSQIWETIMWSLIIYHQGGPCSCPRCKLAYLILLWSIGKILSLRAVYIRGNQNTGANILSRQEMRPGDWRLHPRWWSINGKFMAERKWICLPLRTWRTVHSDFPPHVQPPLWYRYGQGCVCTHFPSFSAPWSESTSTQ